MTGSEHAIGQQAANSSHSQLHPEFSKADSPTSYPVASKLATHRAEGFLTRKTLHRTRDVPKRALS
jgi:hypothetical protein